MRIISNEELLAVAGGDAAATRQPGQNSWGENIPGGLEFLTYVMASAAADTAAYNTCMAENSKPSLENKISSAITATGASAVAGILFGPEASVPVFKVVYDQMNNQAVNATQAGCTNP